MAITGYIYRADNYCPSCLGAEVVKALIPLENQRKFVEGWKELSREQVEEVLYKIATTIGVDRDDEITFDSDEFPKVILSLDDDGLTCGACGENLG